MGNPKQKWTSEEEEALRAGVAKHGTGKWKNIQRDPEFNPFLFSRSNIDLKVSPLLIFFFLIIVPSIPLISKINIFLFTYIFYG